MYYVCIIYIAKKNRETIEIIAEILKKLPLANYVTLGILLYHLKK